MSSRTTPRFRKAFESLHPEIQERAREAFESFQQDRHHPALRLKKVHTSEPIYSVRITLSFRALALRKDDEWIWFWIGSHSDYDSLLDRL